jgi:hypothetical protein
MSRTLLLITGAGRSGTSTAAGTLFHLGVHAPGPHLSANETNPRGFYEAKWSVAFHNRLLKRGLVGLADGRPEAAEIVARVTREPDRRRLADWLEEATAGHELSLVKDPRAAWAHPLWTQVTTELGISLGCLVMLRHPAEVLGSRATHYGQEAETDAGFAVRTLAGWVNTMVTTERQTRGRRRSFLRYDDLLTDWRGAMATVARDLAVDLNVPPPGRPHPADEFVDPALSRHRLTWADVDVPAALEEVASLAWDGCVQLADNGGSDTKAEEMLDEAGRRYALAYDTARQLAHDHTVAEVKKAVRQRTRTPQPHRDERAPAPARPSSLARRGLARLRDRRR